MIISTNIENTNYQQQVNQTISNNDTSSFEELLSNKADNEKGFVLSILDKYNVISSLNLSASDEELFRNILSDDTVSISEMDSLTYEQAVNFSKIMTYNAVPSSDVGNMPLINSSNQIKDMVFATSMTNNTNVNQALYSAARNIDDDLERESLFSQVQDDLVSEYGNATATNLWNIDMMNISLENFFDNMFSKHKEELEEILQNSNIMDEAVTQYEKKINQYKFLLDTYNNIKTVPKNTFSFNSLQFL